MSLHRIPIDQFCALTASNAPAPGGGSVSALCGALSAALSEMVSNLTVDHKGYETVQEEMVKAAAELKEIRLNLLKAIHEDSQSFNAFMLAMKLPKNTDEEKNIRKSAMNEALKNASLVPLQIARDSIRIFEFAQQMLEKGNSNAITDAMVSILTARTAVLGALLNVRINLCSIKDEAFVQMILSEVNELEEKANFFESKLLNLGYKQLKC